METFTDLELKNFCSKEWLVKIDNANSCPYLFKYYCSRENHCSVLVTDTVNVWFEGLNTKQLARRWRLLNETIEPFVNTEQENTWRAKIAKKISIMHTLKPVQDALFSVEDSRDADLAIELQDLDFKWRWECYLLGPKTSARVLSKHLIFPLLSVANIAFTSAESVNGSSATDLQAAVDKVARTGRRAEDIHVRQTLSRPRVATTLARLTALFNYSEDIPVISDEAEEVEDIDKEISMKPTDDLPASKVDSTPFDMQVDPELEIPSNEASPKLQPNVTSASRQKTKIHEKKGKEKATSTTIPAAESDGSATEPESTDDAVPAVPEDQQDSEKQVNIEKSASGSAPPDQEKSDSDMSPPKPPSKKAKVDMNVSDDSDSDSNGKPSGTRKRAPVRAVGVRQPMRRGGRKF